MRRESMSNKTRTVSLRIDEDTYRKILQEGSITDFITQAIDYRLKWLDIQRKEEERRRQEEARLDEKIMRTIETAMEQWKKENGVD